MAKLFIDNEIEVDCIFCLNDGSARVRLDKNGHPYVVCLNCGARTFLKTAKSLAVLGWLRMGLAKTLMADELAVHQAEVAAAELRKRLGAFPA